MAAMLLGQIVIVIVRRVMECLCSTPTDGVDGDILLYLYDSIMVV